MQVKLSIFAAAIISASAVSAGVGYYSCKIAIKQSVSVVCPNTLSEFRKYEGDKPMPLRGNPPPLTGGEKF
jgi:hypothetical protein